MAMTDTGLRTADEIVEFAIWGKQGITLVDTRVRRSSARVRTSEGATGCHARIRGLHRGEHGQGPLQYVWPESRR